jgi:5-methyltetrahydrofolate--homocysteine methyltransferase
MPGLLERIRGGEILVADGAWGTMLMREGLGAGECPEKMNLDNPRILEKIALLYLQAGAEIIQTNTFGGSPLKLSQYSPENEFEKINRIAVEHVRAVAGKEAYVAASCGASGAILKPYGDTNPEEVFDSFEKQMRVLIDTGADLISIETMTDLAEAELAIKAAKSISSSIIVSATMTFDRTPRGFHTIMGIDIKRAAEGLTGAGADIIGSNCGNGIENMVLIAEEFMRHTSMPVLIRSNAGLPVMKDGNISYPESPEFMAAGCRKLFEKGVSIVGGCCGTTPDHIAAFAEVASDFRKAGKIA